MNYNEIIKALERCLANTNDDCSVCHFSGSNQSCIDVLIQCALDLINRQNAEIERLRKLYDGADNCIDELEYALDKVGHANSRVDEALEDYRNLVKEMVGDV